jgi:hypothetical protein
MEGFILLTASGSANLRQQNEVSNLDSASHSGEQRRQRVASTQRGVLRLVKSLPWESVRVVWSVVCHSRVFNRSQMPTRILTRRIGKRSTKKKGFEMSDAVVVDRRTRALMAGQLADCPGQSAGRHS